MWIFVIVIPSFCMITISTQGIIEHGLASSPWSNDWGTCRCGKASVSIAQESGKGRADGDILLHFEKSTDNWRIRILFNQVVDRLRDTAGRTAECDKKACVLESKNMSKKGSTSLLKIKLIAVVKEPRSLAIEKLDLCCDKAKTAKTSIQQPNTHTTNSDGDFPLATSSYTDPAVGSLGETASYIQAGDRVGGSHGATLSYSNVAGSSGSSLGATSSHSVTTDSIGGSLGAASPYSHANEPAVGSPWLTSSDSHATDQTVGSPGATVSDSISDSHITDSNGGSPWATSSLGHTTDQAIGSPGAISYTSDPIAGSTGTISSYSLVADQTRGSSGAISSYGRSIDPSGGSPRATSSSDDPRITTASVVATDKWPPNYKMAATNYYLRVNKIPAAKERRLFKKAETPPAAVAVASPSKQNDPPRLKTLRHRLERQVSRWRIHKVEWPLYPSPDSNYPLFTKVFGFPIFAVKEFTIEYLQHVASVVAELLDNDEDGCVDTPEVVEAMTKSKHALACLVKRKPLHKPGLIGPYKIGISLLKHETKLDCSLKSRNHALCGSKVCFDETYEEAFHLIYKFGYAIAFPRIFGNNFNRLSKLNKAMDKARGGRFYKIPELYPSSAWFTYSDMTCRYSCQVNEYMWWGIASYSNAIARKCFMRTEWKFNSRHKLRKGDVLLTEIIEDTRTYHLPTRQPTGSYFGSKECWISDQDGPVAQE